jgi:hypothetical protein
VLGQLRIGQQDLDPGSGLGPPLLRRDRRRAQEADFTDQLFYGGKHGDDDRAEAAGARCSTGPDYDW